VANKAIQASDAANRDVSHREISPLQDCRDVLHISIFFDGTGNNQKLDGAEKKWSNVGRIYYAMRSDDGQGHHSIYISGVGTPYNGKGINWLNGADVWREDNMFGLVAGAGGCRRLRQGESTVSEALARVLIIRARSFNDETAKYAAGKSAEGLDELNTVLGKYRLIKIIDMSLFGFSRGAALARAFSNRIIKNCTRNENNLLFHGYRIRQSYAW
jgi:hypothetical protein